MNLREELRNIRKQFFSNSAPRAGQPGESIIEPGQQPSTAIESPANKAEKAPAVPPPIETATQPAAAPAISEPKNMTIQTASEARVVGGTPAQSGLTREEEIKRYQARKAERDMEKLLAEARADEIREFNRREREADRARNEAEKKAAEEARKKAEEDRKRRELEKAIDRDPWGTRFKPFYNPQAMQYISRHIVGLIIERGKLQSVVTEARKKLAPFNEKWDSAFSERATVGAGAVREKLKEVLSKNLKSHMVGDHKSVEIVPDVEHLHADFATRRNSLREVQRAASHDAAPIVNAFAKRIQDAARDLAVDLLTKEEAAAEPFRAPVSPSTQLQLLVAIGFELTESPYGKFIPSVASRPGDHLFNILDTPPEQKA